jgi:hypothetical protein
MGSLARNPGLYQLSYRHRARERIAASNAAYFDVVRTRRTGTGPPLYSHATL